MRKLLIQRPGLVAALVTAGLTLLVYSFTLAPDLTWENFGGDGGDLITAAATWGVPHPPGYPTYVLLGKLFSLLPIGTTAYRFNLFSAVCMAVAVGFVAGTAVTLTAIQENGTQMNTDKHGFRSVKICAHLCPSIAVGLAFAFAPLVWSQATIAEVYGLNLAMLAALVWALVGKRPSFLIGLLFGLSLTTHITSIFFAPLVLFNVPKSQWHRLGIGVLLGVAPYLLIFAFARSGSPVIWGNAGTFAGWWWLVSGQAYRGYTFGLPMAMLGSRLLAWGWALLNQFTLLGLPLVIIGGIRLVKRERQIRLVVGGGITAVFILIYAVTYRPEDAIILLLPVILLSALCLYPALQTLEKLALLLPLALLLLNFNLQNLQQSNLRSRVLATFNALPAQAVVMTPGDTTIFTLWYFQQIEMMGTDLVLVDSDLFAFDWYRQQLKQNYPFLVALERDDLDAFQAINGQSRPMCHVSLASLTVVKQTNTCQIK